MPAMNFRAPNRPGPGVVAFQQVRERMDQLNMAVGAQETDLIFLKGLMDGPVLKSLVQAHDRLDRVYSPRPLRTENTELLEEIHESIQPLLHKKMEAIQLERILSDPHFAALLDSHDRVANKDYEKEDEWLEQLEQAEDSEDFQAVPYELRSPSGRQVPLPPPDAVRMVGIRKSDSEPLGVTVKIENGELVIARILSGGMIDRQGLLHVGDIIKEVNGVPVYTPEHLQEHMKRAVGSATLKVIPSYIEHVITTQLFMKAHFDYEPAKDNLIPCKEAGLPFKAGEIIQVVNQEDLNWWQARKITGEVHRAGLIPSQTLEERRKAFVKPDEDFSTSFICGNLTAKRKKKLMYYSNKNADFDRHDLLLYEEVARMPPFQRKTLVLIGAQGVGRRSLKNRLINSDPDRFATTIPHTSRHPREWEEDGSSYFFVTRESMDADIAANRYLENGMYEGNRYGTKLDSIRAVIRSGKMCVLDCKPQALKTLNTSEFMPYVVFVQAPSIDQLREMHQDAIEQGIEAKTRTYDRALRNRTATMSTIASEIASWEDKDFIKTVEESGRLKRAYERYFDLTITNEDFDRTFYELEDAVNSLSTAPQWVPVTWVY